MQIKSSRRSQNGSSEFQHNAGNNHRSFNSNRRTRTGCVRTPLKK